LASWRVRRYEGTLGETRGILAVERATFRECPYRARELQARLRSPQQQLLVAEAEGRIVGFVAGLHTSGLAGPRLEADLLAVEPAWQGLGIATALLTSLRRRPGSAAMLRGVVRPDNVASERAFARAGFRPSAATYDLFIYRIAGLVPRPLPAWGGEIGRLADPAEAAQLAALAPAVLPAADRLWPASQAPGLTLLVARAGGAVAGAAELVEVHTLLYSGLWLESLVARPGQRRTLQALVAAAVEEAKARGMDEVGCLVPQEERSLREVIMGEGFRLLDGYRIWTAPPLPEAAP